jgi:hypothetical protein
MLDQFQECLRLCNNSLRFEVGSDSSLIVVDNVALPPARLKEIERLSRGRPQSKQRCFKSQTMMARAASKSKPRTRDGHLGGLQRGVIGGGESAVVRQLIDCCVFQIPSDQRAYSVQFCLARPVFADFVFRQQRLPAHLSNPLV